MGIYRGVSNVNREISEQYQGISGVNREITEVYRGVSGVNREVFSAWDMRLTYPRTQEENKKCYLQDDGSLYWESFYGLNDNIYRVDMDTELSNQIITEKQFEMSLENYQCYQSTSTTNGKPYLNFKIKTSLTTMDRYFELSCNYSSTTFNNTYTTTLVLNLPSADYSTTQIECRLIVGEGTSSTIRGTVALQIPKNGWKVNGKPVKLIET